MATVEPNSSLDPNTKRPSRRSVLGIRLPNSKPEISQSYWAREQDEEHGSVELNARQKRLELIRQHGSFSLAYSTGVQPLLNYFECSNGFIAYRKRWGSTFALGDPVAPPEQIAEIVDDFSARHRRLSFCQIHEPVARLLSSRGYYVNEMGVDTTLFLPEYTFDGKHKEWLRYASNWTRKRGYQIIESDFVDGTSDEVEEVSEAWRKTRTVKRKEVRFLNRPIVLANEPDVRRFFLRAPNQQLLAFIFLDPIFQNGKTIGYVTSFKRRHPDAPLYAEHAIMKRIIEKLKEEGVSELRLGLSPMAEIEDQKFKYSRLTSRLLKSGFNSKWLNQRFYNVAGHAEYKRRFRGEEQKVYFASRSRTNLVSMLALIGLCGIA